MDTRWAKLHGCKITLHPELFIYSARSKVIFAQGEMSILTAAIEHSICSFVVIHNDKVFYVSVAPTLCRVIQI